MARKNTPTVDIETTPAPKARKPRAKKADTIAVAGATVPAAALAAHLAETAEEIQRAPRSAKPLFGIPVLGLSLPSMGAAIADAIGSRNLLGSMAYEAVARGIGDMMADVNGNGIRAKDPHLYGAAPYKRHSAGTRSHRKWKRERAAGLAG
jgi:hypothetical protein